MRDKRMTSHIGLVARAFGATKLILTLKDDRVVESIDDVRERWGGEFNVECILDWRKFLKKWQGISVHLSMYGTQVDDVIDEISDSKKDMLIIVGAEKVPPEVYRLSDYNVAIGSQPHSEVAALAVFLDRLFKGGLLKKDFNGELKISPSERNKKASKK